MFLLKLVVWFVFFFQAEDGIRDLVRSRGLGDVYKRQFRGRAGSGRIHRHRLEQHDVIRAVHQRQRGAVDTLSLIHI